MSLENLDTTIAFAVVMLLLSLQITVLVQIVIAISNLRGRNLAWGIAQLLEQIDPQLKEHAKHIADEVLMHPAITHSFGGRLTNLLPKWLTDSPLAHFLGSRAVAIRPEELTRLLNDLVSNPSSTLRSNAKAALTTVLKTTVPGATPEAIAKAQAISAELERVFPTQAQAIFDAVNRAVGTVQRLEADLSTWFHTVLDRNSERFVLSTRLITAVIAVLFAFGLQVDALTIIQQLATKSELRARLVQTADTTLQKAENVIATTGVTKPLASGSLKVTKESLLNKAVVELFGEIPDNLVTRGEGDRWLRGKIKDPAQLELATKAYNNQFDKATKDWLGELRTSAGEINSQLQATKLTLIPSPFPKNLQEFFDQLFRSGTHLLGMLITALSLSLGAPFWFNLLRQLANLRPMLAGKVEKETSKESAG